MEQKYCEEESLQHWQLKSEANVKGLGGSSSVSVSLARKFEKPHLDGIKIWEKKFYNGIFIPNIFIFFS